MSANVFVVSLFLRAYYSVTGRFSAVVVSASVSGRFGHAYSLFADIYIYIYIYIYKSIYKRQIRDISYVITHLQ